METNQTKSKLDFLAWFNIFIKLKKKEKKKSTKSCLKINSRRKGGVKKTQRERERERERQRYCRKWECEEERRGESGEVMMANPRRNSLTNTNNNQISIFANQTSTPTHANSTSSCIASFTSSRTRSLMLSLFFSQSSSSSHGFLSNFSTAIPAFHLQL